MNIKLETLLARQSDFNKIGDNFAASHFPIYQTATFDLKKQSGEVIYDYSRTDNPTRNSLENIFAMAENGFGAICTNTGVAALSLLFDTVLETNDTILVDRDCYGGTYRLLKIIKEKNKIDVCYADFTKLDEIENLLLNKNVKLALCESPTNPGLKIIDIKSVASLCIKTNTLLAIDNSVATFASQKPLELGANFSLFSATKFISGHGAVIAGAVVAKEEDWFNKLHYNGNAFGLTQSPFDSFLISIGLPTLTYRMKAQEKSAIEIANFLSSREEVLNVKFPALESHPQHKLALEQMKIVPGIITIVMKSEELTQKFVANTKLFGEKASFGTADSRIEVPSKISHASYSKEDLKKIGLTSTTIRLSIGLEDTQDLINDIIFALEKN